MPLLIYSVTLLAAVLLSERFNRTVLSSAVLFLSVGFMAGPAVFGVVDASADQAMVLRLSDWALVTILFSDALRIGWSDLKGAWRLPGRALFFGLPLTVAGTALAGRWLLGLSWIEAWLVGAILSPTDPVFASAIVGRREIPARLRHLLNVESGLNDGLALPIVVVLLGVAGGSSTDGWRVVREAVGGIAFGAAIGTAAGLLRRIRLFAVSESAAPLHAFSALLITYAGATTLHVNAYLASFSAGVALASACSDAAEEFHGLGEQAAELLKLAAVFIFALMLSGHEPHLPWRDYVFAALVLTAVRFVAIEAAMWKGGLSRPERLTAAWFGPKGFASVVYGLMLLNSSVARGGMLFQLIAVVIVLSIVLHSSTDVPVAKYFGRLEARRQQGPAE